MYNYFSAVEIISHLIDFFLVIFRILMPDNDCLKNIKAIFRNFMHKEYFVKFLLVIVDLPEKMSCHHKLVGKITIQPQSSHFSLPHQLILLIIWLWAHKNLFQTVTWKAECTIFDAAAQPTQRFTYEWLQSSLCKTHIPVWHTSTVM